MPSEARLDRPRAIAGLLCAVMLAGCGSGVRPAHAGPAPAVQGDRGVPPFTAADVQFMSGMIAHHAQAILMTGWAPTHEAGRSVRNLCERIAVSQRDEIVFMQRWLRERHQAVPDASAGQAMPGMAMAAPALMPGMLTADQLAELDSARGALFDRLFLRFMIQHHTGALTMVQQLLGQPGAAQDGQVFQFASDVNADQTAEIDRMRRMLAALTIGERNQ
jgi:uncharacterized protein (DUF305 family)